MTRFRLKQVSGMTRLLSLRDARESIPPNDRLLLLTSLSYEAILGMTRRDNPEPVRMQEEMK
jgi:hypothetical protein